MIRSELLKDQSFYNGFGVEGWDFDVEGWDRIEEQIKLQAKNHKEGAFFQESWQRVGGSKMGKHVENKKRGTRGEGVTSHVHAGLGVVRWRAVLLKRKIEGGRRRKRWSPCTLR
eukprot:gnl/Hemi2/10912_TR3747_c0_g1_i1.p1 gnl/Hemi2/10912_TR3747_c0_g1~~gnl/Hemi2/10912_TR3747_c0_g1_i1.p1  ORF type:complete len:114 (-),score=5.36 gnl/Hemi2/10912_TR3747_c0_g1_i1:2-343(-)